MENQHRLKFFSPLQERLKYILFIFCLVQHFPSLAQKPKISFFSELPSPELEILFSDSLLISEQNVLETSRRMGMLDFIPERAQVARHLNQQGISVVAWLLLPKKGESYWFKLGTGGSSLFARMAIEKGGSSVLLDQKSFHSQRSNYVYPIHQI